VTLRDHVWSTVLLEIRKTGQFVISDLPFNDEQRHTVRRVLREMEKLGWLARENKRAATWRMGEMAKLHLNVSRDLIEESWE
jgi:hypothetical protein